MNRGSATLSVAPQLWKEIFDDLLSTPELERAAIGFAGIVTDANRTRLLLRDWAAVSDDEYQVQMSNHLEVDPSFYARASKRAKTTGEALLIMHSHPADQKQPRFSGSDDFGETRLIPKIQARATVPVGAIVISPGGLSARYTDESGKKGKLAIRPVLEFGSGVDVSAPRRFDRQVRALGSEGHTILASLTVGVVGAGGLGSHCIQQLLHLGVGNIVAIDYDRVDIPNLSRLVGATRMDARRRRPKVLVYQRMARRLGSGSHFTARRSSVTSSAGAVPLLNCDVVVGCTDNHWSRTVLNAIAYQFHIPVVDCGVEIQPDGASGGRVSWLYPGTACLWCQNVIDDERVRIEQLPEATRNDEVIRGYVQGLDEPAPAVISINGVVASLAITELIARTTGVAGDKLKRPDVLLYRLRDGVVRRAATTPKPECMTCGTRGLQGAGQLATVPWTK